MEMKRYEINYLDLNKYTHEAEEVTLAVYGNREELLATIKQMKKEGFIITNVDSVNNNEIYTKIKF